MPKLKIPSQLRPQTNNQDIVEVSGSTVREALENLVSQYPALKDRLFDEKGELRRYVNIYLGEEDIRFLEYLDTPLKEEDEIAIVPAIAGGR